MKALELNGMRSCLTSVALMACSAVTSAQNAPSAGACTAALPVLSSPRFVPDAVTWDSVYVAGEQCVSMWADSMRSSSPVRAAVAREALRMLGGRRAVDALRAEFARAPTREVRVALIDAIGSTGSSDDIAFLQTQLDGPLIGYPSNWPIVQAAVNTLGLLRAQSARDSIHSVLDRSRPSTFTSRAAAAALAALDRPPCADSSGTDREATLIRLTMRCGPEALLTGVRYRDAPTHRVWEHRSGTWQLTTATDSGTTSPSVSITVRLAADNRHAEVHVSMWCGRLCGEGWVYRFLLTEGVWRMVSARFLWVS